MTAVLAIAAVTILLLVPVVRRRAVRRRLVLAQAGRPAHAEVGAHVDRNDDARRPTSGASVSDGRRTRLLLSGALGIALVGLIGTMWSVPLGALAALAVERILRRREPPWLRQERQAAAVDLPLAADLLAAALRAGAPVGSATAAVADALGGPFGHRLRRTARELRLGAAPEEAWSHVADVAGAHRLVAAAVRSAASGGALASALGRVADDLRADRAASAAAAAQRAGVLIVLPLGLCFLPAFLLAGLVPVVTAVLDDVLSSGA